jgi:hypothetical protein
MTRFMLAIGLAVIAAALVVPPALASTPAPKPATRVAHEPQAQTAKRHKKKKKKHHYVPPAPPYVPPSNSCDPSYPNVCLQDGIGDYDCAGGSGNGPNYVSGPVTVIGSDPFGLDTDGDGVGCE